MLLAAASALIFGLEIWIWWLPRLIENLVSADPKWVEYGRIWGHSVWACAKLLGAGDALASALQLGAVLAAALITAVAFRVKRAPDLRLAILLAATILAAPHSGSYDALLLGRCRRAVAGGPRRAAAAAANGWSPRRSGRCRC